PEQAKAWHDVLDKVIGWLQRCRGVLHEAVTAASPKPVAAAAPQPQPAAHPAHAQPPTDTSPQPFAPGSAPEADPAELREELAAEKDALLDGSWADVLERVGVAKKADAEASRTALVKLIAQGVLRPCPNPVPGKATYEVV